MPVKSIKTHLHHLLPGVIGLIVIIILGYSVFQKTTSDKQILTLNSTNQQTLTELQKTKQAYDILKNQDQLKRNDQLQATISAMQATYTKSISAYEDISDLKLSEKTDALDSQYVQIVKALSDKDYTSASAQLSILTKDIQTEKDKLAAAAAAKAAASAGAPANAPASNTPPGSGFSTQTVHTDVGDFTVAIVAADLNSTRVIVDTASDSDCSNNCPVMPLASYVARNGAFAGIKGNYFCPASYPSCAGKTNSFDLLVMNKNKHYFNSDNNVYSTNPAVIFSGNSARFVGAAQEWGRDTSVDAVISNYPLLVSGGNIVYGGGSDPKMGSKGARCFIAASGNTVYIGLVYNATMTEAAHALYSLGVQNAMNLDEGGSTALWYGGGYKAGPGRDLPDALLFVRK